jgi:hypothetical protein
VINGGVSMVFPFVREAIANLTMRGRFGPVWIDPLNVQAIVADAQSIRETLVSQLQQIRAGLKQEGPETKGALPKAPPSAADPAVDTATKARPPRRKSSRE